MNCIYTFNGNPYSLKDLENFLIENYRGEIDKQVDRVYSLAGDKALIASRLRHDSKNVSYERNSHNEINALSSSPIADGFITPQQLVNSAMWTFKNGTRANVELSKEDYIKNMAESFIVDEKLSSEEATAKAMWIVKHWDKICEDSNELHRLINSFPWYNANEATIGNWRNHLDGSPFAAVANLLYTQLTSQANAKMLGMFKPSSDESVSLVRNINLTAKVNGSDKDVVAHYDNIVIDKKGHLHIFNYKYSAAPLSEWSRNKLETYKNEMAVLKQVLAANGYDTSQCTLHIIPIQVKYNDDESVTQAIVHTSSVNVDLDFSFKNGKYAFAQYDAAAKNVIPITEAPVKTEDESPINVTVTLELIFGDSTQMRQDGVRLSVDEFISTNYNTKQTNRIKKVDNGYEVYINDDYSDPIFVDDTTDPIHNQKLRDVIEEHINELLDRNSQTVTFLYDAAYRAINNNKDYIKDSQLGVLEPVLNKALYPYLAHEIDGDKTHKEWSLLESDLAELCGILLFKNNTTGLIDCVCLSTRQLDVVYKYKGNTNILNHFVKDINSGKLIETKCTEANLQALRAAIVVNEIIPSLPNSDSISFGQIKIISRANDGEVEFRDFKHFATEILPQACKFVKLKDSSFNYKNNYQQISFADPVKTLLSDYKALIDSPSVNLSTREELINLNIKSLESESSRDELRKILRTIAQRLELIIKQKFSGASPQEILKSANGYGVSTQAKNVCKLYVMVLSALEAVSGHYANKEYWLNWVEKSLPTQNAVDNKTYRGVVSIFSSTVDEISTQTADALTTSKNGIPSFVEDVRQYYKDSGITKFNTNVVGDLSKAFLNLYKRNDNGQIIMEFKNPYSNEFLDNLLPHERLFLKHVLFRFARIRCLRHGIPFDFSGVDDPKLQLFIKDHNWYFNVPLKKARDATRRTATNLSDKFKRRAKESKEWFSRRFKLAPDRQYQTDKDENIYSWDLRGAFVESDGTDGSGMTNRNRMLAQHDDSYWETDLESLVIDFEEDYIRTVEMNKALIEVKGILLHLEMLGESVGMSKGLKQTIEMIHDFVKKNFFEKSLLDPKTQLFMEDWVRPFLTLVSRAYIAGNIISAFRDTFEGIWQNFSRTANKFHCNLDASTVSSAYKEVILNMFNDTTSINKIDQLCKIFRLSNSDVSRISEQMKSGRGGMFNYENWMYATLRKPDYLNRMVLFVARCMQDGTWDAFSVNEKTGELVYDWKKDKRFKAYAENSSDREAYRNARLAYFNALALYNKEHGVNLTPEEGLPLAYSELEIKAIRELSNNIYGSYDRAMRSALENTAGGMTFAMFTTWMNGHYNNWFRKPGVYEEYCTSVLQETDLNGNNVFLHGLDRVIEKVDENGNTLYFYEETGEAYDGDIDNLDKCMEHVPVPVQGIWYTLKNACRAVKEGEFKQEVWTNPLERENLNKLISDLLMAMLFALLFKLALDPAYKDYKKHYKENNVAASALALLMYNSTSRSYDGFLGPLNLITHIGENSNPPFYTLPKKIITDLGNCAFGNKSFDSVLTGNVAVFRMWQNAVNTYKAQNP